MNVNRIIPVHRHDPLNTLRHFLGQWWVRYALDAMLVPVERSDHTGVEVRMIESPEELSDVNPFAPVMGINSAGLAGQFLHDHPQERLAVILRPCELRTLVELRKKGRIPSQDFVIIGVDCLGLFPPDEYYRQAEKRGKENVTNDMLQNASQGAYRSERIRTACQICDWPAPKGADITIGTLGVDNDSLLLLIAPDEAADARLCLREIAQTEATEYQVSHRETVVGALADRRAEMRERLLEDLQSNCRFSDIGCLLALFAKCTLCGQCLKACPLYGEAQPGLKDHTPVAELVEISHWLTSCSGCGMCEEACPQDVSLTLLVSAISHRIRAELHYTPGNPIQLMPWVAD